MEEHKIAVLTSSGVIVGLFDRRRAATKCLLSERIFFAAIPPATMGQAMDVPLSSKDPSLVPVWADITEVPGAYTSMQSPEFEKSDIESSEFVAPTVITPWLEAGLKRQASDALFPPATTVVIPALTNDSAAFTNFKFDRV